MNRESGFTRAPFVSTMTHSLLLLLALSTVAGRTGYRAGGHANWGAFAALKQDGSITAWGSSEYGSTGAPTDTGYTAIFSTATKGSWPTATSAIFAALKQDGSITAWGSSDYNNDYGSGDSGSGDASPPPVPPPVPPSPPPNNARLGTFRQCADLSAVYPGRTSLGPGSAGQPLSFTVAECAAEVAKASVANGGECGNTFHFLNDQYGPGNYPRCTCCAPGDVGADSPYYDLYQTLDSGLSPPPSPPPAPPKPSRPSPGPPSPSPPPPSPWPPSSRVPTDAGYTTIASTWYTFAALKSDGSITAWGGPDQRDAKNDGYDGYGGYGEPTDAGYTTIFSTKAAFAAIKEDGSITAWGGSEYGGTGAPTDTGYTAIYSTENAFLALTSNGSITAWGSERYGGIGAPTDAGYTKVFATGFAFAALKEDGSITAWGDMGGIGGAHGCRLHNHFLDLERVRGAQGRRFDN